LRHAGRGGEQTPHRGADGKELGSIPFIAQMPQWQPDDGVHQGKHRAQQSQCRIVQKEFLANRFAQRTEQLTIEEIQQIDGEKEKQRKLRAACGLCHDAGSRADGSSTF
jgi:hypothetical protein